MNFKRNLAKISAATALTLGGVATVNAVNNHATVQAASFPSAVTINYVPGYGVNVWSSYNNPTFTGKRLAHGTSWKVFASATDSKGALWYNLGGNQWIQAGYCVDSSSAAASSQSSTSAASKVISLASAQLGKPYVWGGNGPASFDCSGLVNYVYSQVGVSLGRTTYVQVNHGTTVSMNNLKPGDLLFWGSASAPYHVGIYVGNGQYIHAANPGQGVIKQTISQYFYPSVAKRVL
ncbi:C40 family peptidase [Lactobacillus psittaci]|uniref:NlpC P60 family protein n=1 Tax=Lactobacillus psittaci DSM 15354 TaxID=1122152 RepID=A0A0R1SAF1_9LACO|nr:C40 family peptidase [Lactobacillus psittaci]KRL63365.1 NlpC P60 family protein [Lactobacillus psittaci DSM 15354]